MGINPVELSLRGILPAEAEFAAWEKAAAKQAASYPPSATADVIQAFARLGREPSFPMREALNRNIIENAGRFTPAELCACLYAATVLGALYDGQAFGGAIEAIRKPLATVSIKHLRMEDLQRVYLSEQFADDSFFPGKFTDYRVAFLEEARKQPNTVSHTERTIVSEVLNSREARQWKRSGIVVKPEHFVGALASRVDGAFLHRGAEDAPPLAVLQVDGPQHFVTQREGDTALNGYSQFQNALLAKKGIPVTRYALDIKNYGATDSRQLVASIDSTLAPFKSASQDPSGPTR